MGRAFVFAGSNLGYKRLSKSSGDLDSISDLKENY